MEASTLTHASRSGLLARRSPLLRLQGDDKLVGLIREHHDRAFEVLFDRYQSRLLAFCRGILSSSEDAEDVLQEVFVNAHAAMLADTRPINVRPWLYRIARNRCLNHLRKPVPEGQDTMDVLESNGAGTLERVQRREELKAIFADVGELPETQRTALVLREIDDLSYEEIAEAMGTTLPAVKSLLVRARMSLAEASESRVLDCSEVRLLLAEAAEGLSKLDGASRHHVRKCEGCGRYRSELRSSTKALAALSPVFPLLALKALIAGKIFGGSSSGGSAGSAGGAGATGAGTTGAGAGAGATGAGAAGGAAAGTSGAAIGAGAAGAGLTGSGIGSGLAGGALGAVGAKAATGFATAALITAGAVGVQDITSKSSSRSAPTASSATARVSGSHRAADRRVMSSHATGGASSQATSATGSPVQDPRASTGSRPKADAPPAPGAPPTGSTTGDPGTTTPPPSGGATGTGVDGSGGVPDASGQGAPPPTYGGPAPEPPPVLTPPPTPSPAPIPPVVIPPTPDPQPTPDPGPPPENGPPPTTNAP